MSIDINKCVFGGNLTRDPDCGYTQSQIPWCRFTLAVNRRFANRDGQREADFINVVAWRQLAELCVSYLHKGSPAVAAGSINTRTYTGNDGVKRTAYELVADEVHFAGGKRGETGNDIPDPPPPQEYEGNAVDGKPFP